MPLTLDELVDDFAAALQEADAKRPQAQNTRSGKPFQPGIGPHTEAQTVALVCDELVRSQPHKYDGQLAQGVSYPDIVRQKCDLCYGSSLTWEWAIEVKMLRLFGDNGKLNDNILMHILSPYAQHRSALTDCSKLARTTVGDRHAILIYGYEHGEWPLEPAFRAFEILANDVVNLGPRRSASFDDLVHPVHRRGQVVAWEVGDAR